MFVSEAFVADTFTIDAVFIRASFRDALPYMFVIEAVRHDTLSIVPTLPVIVSARTLVIREFTKVQLLPSITESRDSFDFQKFSVTSSKQALWISNCV